MLETVVFDMNEWNVHFRCYNQNNTDNFVQLASSTLIEYCGVTEWACLVMMTLLARHVGIGPYKHLTGLGKVVFGQTWTCFIPRQGQDVSSKQYLGKQQELYSGR